MSISPLSWLFFSSSLLNSSSTSVLPDNVDVKALDNLLKALVLLIYQKATDENGNENSKYFEQDLEMDSYAFTYYVMKYKYGDVSHLYLPEAYKESVQFFEIVNDWIEIFENNLIKEKAT